MRKTRISILMFFIILFSFKLKAQTVDSALTGILRKLSDYTSQVPREEIFIHTDRESYVAGEDIWFNVYLIDRKSLRLSDESSIAYIEILNIENKPVLQKRIVLKEGAGPGHLVLPDTLNTGIYTLRAYTNRMKNFLPYNAFNREIAVYNTLKKEIKTAVKNRNEPLPAANHLSPGPVIRINDKRPDSLEVHLERTDEDNSGAGRIYYLVIQTRGNADFSGILKPGKFSKNVSKETLPEGISEAVVFDEKGNFVASRHFYIPSKPADSLGISVKESYTVRDRINIAFAPGKISPGKVKASISVSPLTGAFVSEGIDDYLVFGSEFNNNHGYIHGNILKGLSEQERDSILERLTSNWINWAEILSGHLPEMKYLPEKDYHFIYGFIPGGMGDTVLMCSPSARTSFRYTRTDSEGNFIFRVHPDEEPKDIIFIPISANAEDRPVIISSFPDKYFNFSKKDTIGISPGNFSRTAVSYQVRRLFNTNSAGDPLPPFYTSEKPARIYGIPDLEFKLSDYIELPTMDEVFLELIPGVSLRNSKQGYKIQMTERINDKRIELDPTLMIDGIPVKDASLIAGIDPALVDRIDITSQKYLIGDYLFDGMVNVVTKSADFSCIPMPEYMSRIKYAVSDPVPKFVSPDYTSVNFRNSRIPDYRNTLYWNPTVSSSLTFWSSDNRMKYVIRIEGINEEGKPFSIRKTFSVE